MTWKRMEAIATPSSSGSRSTVAGRQAGGRTGWQMIFLQFTKFLTFANFNSKTHLDCLNGFIVLTASYQ